MWPWRIHFSFIKTTLCCSLKIIVTKIIPTETPLSATVITHWCTDTDNSKIKRLLYVYCNSIKLRNYNLSFSSMQHLTKHWEWKCWMLEQICDLSLQQFICFMGDFSRGRSPPLSDNVKLWFRASFADFFLFCLFYFFISCITEPRPVGLFSRYG